MVTITNLLPKPYASLFTFHHTGSFSSFPSSSTPNSIATKLKSSTLILKTSQAHLIQSAKTYFDGKEVQIIENFRQVHSIEDLDEALQTAKNKLLVALFASNHNYHINNTCPFMVQLSQTYGEVQFLLIIGDESEKTRELCYRENVQKVPYFIFYKNLKKIHEEEIIELDQLIHDILYYGDDYSSVVQLDFKEDLQALIEYHKDDDKLIVVNLGLMQCFPCVKVYPTVVHLSEQMNDKVVFARMNGDKNGSCIQFLKDMNATKVPTFLFIRDGEICGRYVGSSGSGLVREIHKHQSMLI